MGRFVLMGCFLLLNGVVAGSDAVLVPTVGEPGLIGAKFTGATSLNTTSEPSAGEQLGVFADPPQIYNAAGNLPEQTTFSYSGYMWLDAGTYNFKGSVDDFSGVKINGQWLFNNNGSGNFTAPRSGWYPVDFRAGNSGGPGGLYNSSQFGILWKKSTDPDTDASWRRVTNGDGVPPIFFTFTPVGPLPPSLKVNPKTWDGLSLGISCSFDESKSDFELVACCSETQQNADTNAWTCVSFGNVAQNTATRDISVSVPSGAKFVRICAVAQGGVYWSRTIDIDHVRELAIESVKEFNAAGSTEASFVVDVTAIGAGAENATISVKYGTSKDALAMTKELGTITEPGVVSNVVTGLQMDTKYWWQVVIENNNGQSWSSDVGKIEIVRRWSYRFSNGEATVTGLPPDAPAELIIPEVINGYPVTSMSFGYRAFDGQSRLTIPSSVTNVVGHGTTFGFNRNLTIDWYVSKGIKNVDDIFAYYNNYYGYGKINVYAYGAYPNYFPKESIIQLWCTREVAGSWFSEVGYNGFQGYLDSDDPDDARPLTVRVTSTTMHANDPTIMDVDYIVSSKKPKVKTRVLAYQDATKSFAKVVRPETFTAETRAFVGDDVTANETHRISWHVAADWNMDLATVAFEVLAREDELVPLELATVPATASHAAITYSWNGLTAEQILGALYWLYADGDPGLTLQNGYLKANGVTLASGNALSNAAKATEYVLGKMGYGVLSGDDLAYVNSVSGLNLAPSGVRQYAVKYPAPPASQEE